MFLVQEDGDIQNNPYTDYLQKNYLPEEDVYKPKKKKDTNIGERILQSEIPEDLVNTQ